MPRSAALLLLFCAQACLTLRLADWSKLEAGLEEEDRAEKKCKNKDNPLAKLKIFYVNEATQTERKDCLERQLAEQCLKAERFEAVTIEEKPNLFDLKSLNLMTNDKYRDCFVGGIDFSRVVTHGTWSGLNLISRGTRILANWCSHFRLLSRAQDELPGKEDYILMLEDDVLIDQKNFVPVLKDFLKNYNGTWDLVQLDAFGPGGRLEREDEIEKGYVQEAMMEPFRGKEIYKPVKGDGFWGFQAVLVRAASLPKIVEKMSQIPALPYDWLHKRMNEDQTSGLTALTFQAGITKNPEVLTMFDKGDIDTSGFEKPKYCSDQVMKSTLA